MRNLVLKTDNTLSAEVSAELAAILQRLEQAALTDAQFGDSALAIDWGREMSQLEIEPDIGEWLRYQLQV